MPSGPTVTASGRQVRSRATGLYGETLHSGQVSDRASPATGDYVRSDISEEPPHAHGRSTRAANRGTANGRPSRRALDSEDEEDATSWDGGDEDDDEPEKMELDDDEDDQGDDSSEHDEPQTLIVTLRYPKGSFNPSGGPTANSVPHKDTSTTNGVAHHETHPPSAQRQPPLAPAPVEPPQQHAIYPQPSGAFISNGIPILSHPPPAAPTAAVAHQPLPMGDPVVLPKLDGFFAAPTPLYGAPQHNVSVPHQHQSSHVVAPLPPHAQPLPPPPQQQQPVIPAQPPHHPAQQQPFAPMTVSPSTPASNWQ